jgi:CheY-like chemotaxis protein
VNRKLPNPRLEIAVEDTGIGISQEQVRKLFKPFEQGDNSITRRYGGTGLGLAISQYIAAELGGNISVESKLGEGTTFFVSLATGPLTAPIPRGASLATETTVRDERIPESPALASHVLVVEDNNVNQMFITELLRHVGCTSDIAGNGAEALTALDERDYDLVLMDCQMPEMDGYTATREIRRKETARRAARRTPIIALTANALSGDRERCLAAGMDDFLTKPIRANKLRAVLQQFSPTGTTNSTVSA